MYKVLFFVILCFLFYQCLPTDEKNKFNEELLNHENLTIFSANAESEVAVRFEREQIFGSTNDVLIGRIGGIAVDAKDRIYIGDARGFTIHIFQPEGSHLVSIGRQGNGPGEFVSPPFPVITSNRLYVYDHMQRRVKIFSTDTFEFAHAINLDFRNQDVITKNLKNSDVNEWWILEDTGELLAKFTWPRTYH